MAEGRSRLEQLLGRDATDVQARPAHLLVLDDGDVESGRCAVEGGGVTAGTAADDGDVMVSCGHVWRCYRRFGSTNVGGPVSTRRLIVAALLCGLAILVAFTAQILTAK